MQKMNQSNEYFKYNEWIPWDEFKTPPLPKSHWDQLNLKSSFTEHLQMVTQQKISHELKFAGWAYPYIEECMPLSISSHHSVWIREIEWRFENNLWAFAAYDSDGRLVHWGPVSGGQDWCEDVGRPCRTATGSYQIFRKQGVDCESSVFPIETEGGAPMPWCMHYYNGFALHGSTLPGYHASHGCIRLFYDDAKWLNQHFVKIGTRIVVVR